MNAAHRRADQDQLHQAYTHPPRRASPSARTARSSPTSEVRAAPRSTRASRTSYRSVRSGCAARSPTCRPRSPSCSTGQKLTGTHHETFPMRREQAEAVNKTHAYFHSIWDEDMHAVPRFLWNAKMRFGKTFTAYQLAKKLGAKRVLVVTFKPAVEDAWQTDLETHVDFDGWQYLSQAVRQRPDADRPRASRSSTSAPSKTCSAATRPATSSPRTSGSTTINWDLVVFDEYHFGAWRDTAKELFEGEDERSPRRRPSSSTTADLEVVNEDSSELSRGRDRVPAHHDQGVPLPLRHAVQGAGHRRVHRGADLQLDLHRRAARQGGVRRRRTPTSGTPTARCRRCAC